MGTLQRYTETIGQGRGICNDTVRVGYLPYLDGDEETQSSQAYFAYLALAVRLLASGVMSTVSAIRFPPGLFRHDGTAGGEAV